MRGIGLYEYAPIQECIDVTGKPRVSTKWVRTNKGTREQPEVRCRPVARDFKLVAKRTAPIYVQLCLRWSSRN